MTTAISIGPATAILANVVYALPAKLCFITSTVEVETSVDGLIWTALTGSDTTGAIAPGVFVRCSSDATVVLRDAVGIYSSGSSGSNPFDQDLNTTNSVQFAGLGIGTAGVVNTLALSDGFTIRPVSSIVTEVGTDAGGINGNGGTYSIYVNDGVASSGSYDLFGNDGHHVWGSGAFIMGFDNTGLLTVPTISASGYNVGATPGIDTTITTGSLVGKTITITKGIITGFA